MMKHLFANPLVKALFEEPHGFVGLYKEELGWFVQVNTAGYRLLGYQSTQEFYTTPRRSLQATTTPAAERRQLLEAVQAHGRHEQLLEVQRQSGETFRAQTTLTPLTLEDQAYVLVQLRDADQAQFTERRLAQSVERFEAVFTHATIGIIVCNRAGTIVLANKEARKQFDYHSDMLVGQRIEALVPGAERPAHQAHRESFNAHPEVRAMGHNRDLLARRRDGSVFPVEISLSYFHLDDELFVVAYIIDITFKRDSERELIAQRQRVEVLNSELEQKVADRTHALETTLAQLELRTQALAQALATEQELGELKSRFVSMASHEFRTPLTGVLTSATLIEKYTTTEQQDKRQRHLSRIRTSVNHLTDILEEFLSVGKIEEGRIVARPSRVELPLLLHEAQAEVQGLRKTGQHLDLHLDVPGPLWLDPSLLRKVLVNLLSNAFKYSGENTTVTVRARGDQQWLTLSVQDCGVGIAPEDQEHLFERFFRARNATNIPGTGLGLYIIAKYLELMGGTVSLKSALGVGTTITITVPYENHSAD